MKLPTPPKRMLPWDEEETAVTVLPERARADVSTTAIVRQRTTARRARQVRPPPLAPALAAWRARLAGVERARRLFGLAQAAIVQGDLWAAYRDLKLAVALDPDSRAYRAELRRLAPHSARRIRR